MSLMCGHRRIATHSKTPAAGTQLSEKSIFFFDECVRIPCDEKPRFDFNSSKLPFPEKLNKKKKNGHKWRYNRHLQANNATNESKTLPKIAQKYQFLHFSTRHNFFYICVCVIVLCCAVLCDSVYSSNSIPLYPRWYWQRKNNRNRSEKWQ